jgi:phosphoglycerate dehydrogenase-like enzyme
MKQILIDLDLEPRHLERLRALPGATVHLSPEPTNTLKEKELPPALLRDKHVILCKRPPLNLKDAADLELLHLGTVGFDHINHLKLHESPARVCNARGIFDTAIGEWCLAMMVNLVRDVPGMLRNQREKVWSRDAHFHQEVRNKTVGVWGYGGIGREVARLAKAFGMTVHVLSRSGAGPRRGDWTPPGTGDPDGTLPDRVFGYDRISEFLGGLDFLVLCLPKTAGTVGIVGRKELAALPQLAWLLNVARGPIIEEAALLDVLRAQRIAGAALDVHYTYPLPPEHPLWEMPNVILTPHISGSELSTDFRPRISELMVENVRRYLEGRPLFNEITKEEFRATAGAT